MLLPNAAASVGSALRWPCSLAASCQRPSSFFGTSCLPHSLRSFVWGSWLSFQFEFVRRPVELCAKRSAPVASHVLRSTCAALRVSFAFGTSHFHTRVHRGVYVTLYILRMTESGESQIE